MTTRFDGELTLASTSTQHTNPKVKALPTGGFVTVYQYPVDGGEIFMEIRDALGRVTLQNRTVNTDFTGNQTNPDVAVLSNGDIVVVWEGETTSSGKDVFARRYGADGTPKSEPWRATPEDNPPHDQLNPSIIGLSGGGFAISYEMKFSNGITRGHFGIYDQNANLVAHKTPFFSLGNVYAPKLVQLSDGTIVAAYGVTSGQTDYDVWFNKYTASGVEGSREEVLVTGPGRQLPGEMTALSNGSLAATWTHSSGSTQGKVQGRIIGPSANFTFEMAVAGQQLEPTIQSLNDGRFVLAIAQRNTSTDKWVIRAQVFEANGSRAADEPEIVVNTGTTGDSVAPDVTVLRDGRFIISWSEVNTNGTMSAKAQIFDPRRQAVSVDGTSGNDMYVASDFDGDSMRGHDGDDVFVVTNLSDANDVFDGGNGSDAVSYIRAKSGVTVNLNSYLHLSIENLFGSTFGDDLRGDKGINTLSGEQGNDTLYGGADQERDYLFGGEGKDTVTYQHSASGRGVYIDLFTLENNSGDALDDVYDSIEVFIGTNSADQMYGDLDSIEFQGGFGNDTLKGGIGNDKLLGEADSDALDGGKGNDTLDGSAGFDLLIGGDGDDVLDGGADRDVLRGGSGNDRLVGGGDEDVLTGGLGADQLIGGDGLFDMALYEGDDGQGVTANLTDSTKNKGEAEGDTYEGIENMAGTRFADILTGRETNNTLYGREGNDKLEGMGGDDDLRGGAGADILDGGSGNDWATYDEAKADAGNLWGVRVNLTDNSQNAGDQALGDVLNSVENIRGSNYQDVLIGNESANILEGGGGSDWLYGGGGTAGDALVGGDTDEVTVWDYATYEYSTATDGITLDLSNRNNDAGEARGDVFVGIDAYGGTHNADRMVGVNAYNEFNGNGGNDTLVGGSANDYLNGGDGDDVLEGGGNGPTGSLVDILVGGDGNDAASYENATAMVDVHLADATKNGGDAKGDQYLSIENVIGSKHGDWIHGDDRGNVLEGRGGADSLWGEGGDDRLVGGDGSDWMEGGAGADTMVGGNGGDTYWIRDASDVVVEEVENTGTDRAVIFTDYFKLEDAVGLEILEVHGSVTSSVHLIGNKYDNELIGSYTHVDKLEGGEGNDRYFITEGDVVIDTGGEHDSAYAVSSGKFTAADGIETLSGGEDIEGLWLIAGDHGTTVIGTDMTNTLQGGAGVDTLQGGWGSDVYYADADDVIQDDAGTADTLMVTAAGKHSLEGRGDIEILQAELGVADVWLIARPADDGIPSILIGNDLANTLESSGADDYLEGREGNDTYIVTAPTVTVDDNGDDTDIDTIILRGNFGSESGPTVYFLASGIEILDARDATGALALIGNHLANTIYGNGSGSELVGGAGNDTYYVGVGDTVFEGPGEGTADKAIITGGTFTLGDDVEVEVLQAAEGTFPIHLIGNNISNHLIGNAGRNYLHGGAGEADRFEGGDGNDTYVFANKGDDLSKNDTGGDMDVAYIWDSNFVGGAAEAAIFADYLKSMGIDYVYRNITPPPPPTGGQGPESDPTDIALTSYKIDENSQGLSIIGELSAVDDVQGPFKYRIVGDADEKFLIERLPDGRWVLRLRENATLDFEADPFHKVSVEVTDIDGGKYTEELTIEVNDVAEGPGNGAPTNIAFSDSFVREHLGSGNNVGALSAVDPDGDSLTWTLTNDANGIVYLEGNEIKVKDHTKLDFEQLDTRDFTFTIRVSDGQGNAVEQSFTVAVENIITERVTGTDKDNLIKGGGGKDRLNGGDGNDTLSGGSEADTLIGGAGDDVFLFDSRFSTSNVDSISNFEIAADKIHLERDIFTAFAESDVGQNLPGSAFVVGLVPQDADDRIIYDQTSGKLYYDSDGTGATAARHFATLAANLMLTSDHFKIV
ncbi:hypothetical protein [Microvirga sp. VF16]|uniref:hypothetical protein n=1 Tax=Microvirga sp. VF16 TaxID=2807101 RepID=UPI00193E20D8|nr:hypothetical protein [Microvirga sp. VF16]QRM27455.1 hypothetical protein JO965_14230 [Microvirga sp. VF16]